MINNNDENHYEHVDISLLGTVYFTWIFRSYLKTFNTCCNQKTEESRDPSRSRDHMREVKVDVFFYLTNIYVFLMNRANSANIFI